MDSGKKESQSLNQFLDTSLQIQNPLNEEKDRFPLGKDLAKIPKNFAISLSPTFPQRDFPWFFFFSRLSVHCGSNWTFQGLLDTGSELILFLLNPEKHCSPPVKGGASGGQVD